MSCLPLPSDSSSVSDALCLRFAVGGCSARVCVAAVAVVAQPEDRNVYELHVRDFSIGDETVPAAERGTFAAFTEQGSAGTDAE